MKLSLLLLSSSTLLSSPSSSVLAYFAQANNAHVEFVALTTSSSESSGGGDATAELLLLSALQEKIDELKDSSLEQNSVDNEGVALSLSSASAATATTTTADTVFHLFEEWARKFDKEYESLYERGNKMLVWLENHGEHYDVWFQCWSVLASFVGGERPSQQPIRVH